MKSATNKSIIMRKGLIIAIVLTMSVFSSFRVEAQKLYVWAPETEDFVQHPLFEASDTVDIIVFDGRNFPSKSKVECTSEEFVDCLIKDIQHTYEGATFNVLPTAKYFKETGNGHITIKIGIAAYQAGFGADVDVAIGSVGGSFSYGISPKGRWNGITSFLVKVSDKRNGDAIEKEKEVISQIDKSNTFGYKTAKQCLNESYIKAFSQLVFFVDSVFM